MYKQILPQTIADNCQIGLELFLVSVYNGKISDDITIQQVCEKCTDISLRTSTAATSVGTRSLGHQVNDFVQVGSGHGSV